MAQLYIEFINCKFKEKTPDLSDLPHTVEDRTNRSSATTASLYNGQPLDTGSMCHGAGLTSCMSAIHDVKDGVSVDNAHRPTLQWYVLRVSYGRIHKATEALDAKHIESYVPMRYRQEKKSGKTRIVKEPLLPYFIFAHSTKDAVERLLQDTCASSNGHHPLLSYYYDHTNNREDAPDRNPPLVIRDEAMYNFIRLTSIKNPHIIPITSENIQYKLGDEVVVTEGDFKGIRGRVARIAGQQRVIVELFGGCLVATAYIPKEAMRKTV